MLSADHGCAIRFLWRGPITRASTFQSSPTETTSGRARSASARTSPASGQRASPAFFDLEPMDYGTGFLGRSQHGGLDLGGERILPQRRTRAVSIVSTSPSRISTLPSTTTRRDILLVRDVDEMRDHVVERREVQDQRARPGSRSARRPASANRSRHRGHDRLGAALA